MNYADEASAIVTVKSSEKRTVCNDWMASVVSWASVPKRKMGRLYTGAANALVMNESACKRT